MSSMLSSGVFFILGILISASAAADKVCAKNYSELDRTPHLQTLKTIIEDHKRNGFVNKTEGSYFFINSGAEEFHITFYTTGFLDLYGISKNGPIYFCDEDSKLTAVGLDRTQNIFVDKERLEFGHRSARESFIRGPMPEKLAKINDIDVRTLASY